MDVDIAETFISNDLIVSFDGEGITLREAWNYGQEIKLNLQEIQGLLDYIEKVFEVKMVIV